MTEPNKAVQIFASAGEARSRVTDGFDNFLSRIGLNNDNSLSGSLYTFNLLTRNRMQLETAYRGSWVAGMIVDAVAEDMTRAGIDITTNESNADIKDLQTAISRLQLWNSNCDGIKWGRLYGGAIGVMQIEGQKLDTPLDVRTVSKAQFKGLAIFDRWQLNPDLQNIIAVGPEMGLPQYYDIVTNPTSLKVDPAAQGEQRWAPGQVRVHHSRCIRFIGIKLPFFQAITEMMWGESELERPWDRMIAFDNATMSAASLVDRANLRTAKIDGLREIIAQGGKAQQGLEAMFDMMRRLQTNEGLTLVDKNDDIETTSYTFAGLPDTILQFGQQLSGASGIPLVRFFGQSPAGLNSTGESDLRMYYDNIHAKQESHLRRPWEVLLSVLWRSVYGKEPPKDLEFKFTPLWQTSLIDKATIAKSNTETIIGAHEAGLVKTSTAMEELRSSSDDTGLFSNISDKDIKEADIEEPPVPTEAAAPGSTEATSTAKPGAKPVKPLDAAKPSAAARIANWLMGRKAA